MEIAAQSGENSRDSADQHVCKENPQGRIKNCLKRFEVRVPNTCNDSTLCSQKVSKNALIHQHVWKNLIIHRHQVEYPEESCLSNGEELAID